MSDEAIKDDDSQPASGTGTIRVGAVVTGRGFYTPPGGTPVPFEIRAETDLTPEELAQRGIPVTVQKEKPDGDA